MEAPELQFQNQAVRKIKLKLKMVIPLKALPSNLTQSELVKEKIVMQETVIKFFPNSLLRDFFKELLKEADITHKGTGKMVINFSQYSAVSLEWREK